MAELSIRKPPLVLFFNFKWKTWKITTFLLCKLDYSANSRYFFPIFQSIKRIYEIFSPFISLAVDLFLNHNESFSFSKPFMHQFVHFSPSLNNSLQIHFCPKIFISSDSNSQNLDWDIIERFPVFYHYKTFIFHASLSMGTDMFISTIKCEIFLTGTVIIYEC